MLGPLADKVAVLFLCAQRQMHRLFPHDIVVHHAPQLQRQAGEKHALALGLRARIEYGIRLRGEGEGRHSGTKDSMVWFGRRLCGGRGRGGERIARFWFVERVVFLAGDVVWNPADAGQQAEEPPPPFAFHGGGEVMEKQRARSMMVEHEHAHVGLVVLVHRTHRRFDYQRERQGMPRQGRAGCNNRMNRCSGGTASTAQMACR